jgi:hypothetical protein
MKEMFESRRVEYFNLQQNNASTSLQGYSLVIMGLTNIETQPVIHFHHLRGSFTFI